MYLVGFTHRATNRHRQSPYGVRLTGLGTRGTGDGQFGYPQDVAVASDGSVYVADGGNHRIQKFSVGP